MRVVLPRTDASPVGPLLRDVVAAIGNIAPERAQAFVAQTASLTLEIIDVPETVCEYSPDDQTVRISCQMIELLWAFSYAYFVLYTRKFVGRRVDRSEIVDLQEDPVLADAMSLLAWAISRELGVTTQPWLPNTPRPEPNPAHASDKHVADELALCALAFILHHELAHARLRHVELEPGADSIDQERDADYEAADWILGGLPETERDGALFRKRALGVAVGLTHLAAIGIHAGDEGGRSHPRPFDRLLHTLDRFIGDSPDHQTWGFVSAMLNLHLDNSAIKKPDRPYETFREAVDAYVETLAAAGAVDGQKPDAALGGSRSE